MTFIDPYTGVAGEVRDLVTKARTSLQGAETVGPDHSFATTRSVYYLATAIDKLVNETLVPDFKQEDTLDEYGPEQLEALYNSITDRTGQCKFIVSFPDVELSIEDIWPDGDAPEDPTPGDVLARMKLDCLFPIDLANEWSMIDNLQVIDAKNRCGVIWEET